jgi:hypothetical protein
LGFPTGWSFTTHKDVCSAPSNISKQLLFWRRCRGTKKNNLPRQLGALKRSSFFSGAVAGEERRLLRGEFSHTHSLLCFIVLLYFILFYLHCFLSKTQKN